jgi:hypothetical protein
VVFAVDWSSLPLYRSLAVRMGPGGLPPLVYLNYRVFSRTAESDEKLLVSRCVQETVHPWKERLWQETASQMIWVKDRPPLCARPRVPQDGA